MDKSLKKANEYIGHDNSDLRTILEKIKLLSQLNNKIEQYLDPAIVRYCQVANLINGKLVLIVANGSIATQLRYQASDLLGKFRKDKTLSHIISIECKVRPIDPIRPLLPKKAKCLPPLSPETAEVVKTIAETIEDPKLREIMLRIAEHM